MSSSSSDLHLVCLLDVLGFEKQLETLGLAAIHAKYSKLIEYVKRQKGGFDIVPTPDGHVACGWLIIGNAYFSDSLLFWTRYNKMALPSFTHCIAEAICFGLEIELPLRGAMAVGEAILDEEQGVFLGAPLVEVARIEKSQEWVGVSFGPSFAKPDYSEGFHLHTVLPYKSHYKDQGSEYVTGMTVDWPRRWREGRKTDARAILKLNDRDPKYSRYYSRTERFIAFSEENHDWFRKQDHLSYG